MAIAIVTFILLELQLLSFWSQLYFKSGHSHRSHVRKGLVEGMTEASCLAPVQRDDREIVLAAVQRNGLALQFATESCRGDREIVLAAVRHDWRALQFTAE
eukprot:1322521-Amphidinium_carterae.1